MTQIDYKAIAANKKAKTDEFFREHAEIQKTRSKNPIAERADAMMKSMFTKGIGDTTMK